MENYLNYYHREKAIPMIIDVLSKEGIKTIKENIKSWNQPRMSYEDVIRGINYVKTFFLLVIEISGWLN